MQQFGRSGGGARRRGRGAPPKRTVGPGKMTRTGAGRKPAMVGGAARARRKGKRKYNKAIRRARRHVLLGYVLAALVAVMSPPTFLLIVVGMAPTLVAFIVDDHPSRAASRTVGAMNLAGVVPFIAQLWVEGAGLASAIALLTSSRVLLTMYLAAGAGWMLLWVSPALAVVYQDYRASNRVEKLRAMQKELVAEWGDEVTSGAVN